MFISLFKLSLAVLCLFGCFSASGFARPALIVQITVDQLRGDMPLRFHDRFPEGGLRRFMDEGTVYTNAHYRHSTTYTGVGHATLFTGADPIRHGIVANDWRDPVTGKGMYCCGDEEFGLSPRNLMCTTIGDELTLASAGGSRVFGVSLKDRGAILPAGHTGKAFWYGGEGAFVSNAFYYETTPAWAEAFNASNPAQKYIAGGTWDLLHPREEYLFKDRDDQPWEQDPKPLGRVFPHPLGEDPLKALRGTPFADNLTLDFARALVEGENLGGGAHTDLLSVSLSMTDSIGHTYGPDSLEAEDNLLRLDRGLAEFFAFLDARLGKANYVLAISSDHGVCPAPGMLHAQGLPTGAVITGEHVRALNTELSKTFGTTQTLIADFSAPCFYLNRAALAAAGVKLDYAAQELAALTRELEGVAFAFSRPELVRGELPDDPIAKMAQRSFCPSRSGDVLVIQRPGWMLGGYGQGTTHGSAWTYDTHVPIYFVGPGIKAQIIDRAVVVNDIAPTWAAMLGISPPSANSGAVLEEVLKE